MGTQHTWLDELAQVIFANIARVHLAHKCGGGSYHNLDIYVDWYTQDTHHRLVFGDDRCVLHKQSALGTEISYEFCPFLYADPDFPDNLYRKVGCDGSF